MGSGGKLSADRRNAAPTPHESVSDEHWKLISLKTAISTNVEKVKGCTITSPPQTYLDLFSLRGRGQEAAEFFEQCFGGRMVGSRTDYPDLATEAARMVMLELVRILGEYKDSYCRNVVATTDRLFAQTPPPQIPR